jgi:hypothetical protein
MSVLFLALAFACWLFYWVNGSTIDTQGILHEPFFLIPVGWLAFALGLLAGVRHLFALLRDRLSRHRA